MIPNAEEISRFSRLLERVTQHLGKKIWNPLSGFDHAAQWNMDLQLNFLLVAASSMPKNSLASPKDLGWRPKYPTFETTIGPLEFFLLGHRMTACQLCKTLRQSKSLTS